MSTITTVRPYHLALYSSLVRNVDHDTSAMLLAKCVLLHVLNLQVPKANHLVFVYQPCGQFVQKAAIGYFLMQAGHLDTSLVPIGTALLSAGEDSLPTFQLLLILSQILWIGNDFTGGKRCKILDSKINAHLDGQRQATVEPPFPPVPTQSVFL